MLDADPTLMLQIIMQGYDGREEFAAMPAVGANANLKPEEIAAIMNHERTSWGNDAPKVTADEVKKLMDTIKQMPVQ